MFKMYSRHKKRRSDMPEEYAPLIEESGGSNQHSRTNDESDDRICFKNNKPLPVIEIVPLQTKVYFRRWYLLTVFSLIAFMQCTVWTTWGPLDMMVKKVFNWNDTTLALLGLWGTCTYIIFVWPLCCLIENQGIRVSVALSTGLLAIGTSIRCFNTTKETFTIIAHVAAFVSGIGGVIISALPPALSSTWFPPHQRTTATGIASMANQLGIAGGYLGGYLLTDKNVNSTGTSNSTCEQSLQKNVTSCNDPSEITDLRSEIMDLMYIEAGITCFLLLLFLCYFPNKPTLPPSHTCITARLGFVDGLLHLVRNRNIWFLAIAFSISQGVPGAWTGIMNITLQPLGVSQQTAGLIGMASIIASCCCAVAFSMLNDKLKKHLKGVLTGLLISSSLAFTWLYLICLKIIPFNEIQMCTAVIIGTAINFAAYPLFMECAVEIAYPVPEGLVGGILTTFYNTVSSCFYLVFLIPNIGYHWMNHCLVASNIIVLPLVLLVNVSYNRLNEDEEDEASHSQQFSS